MRVDIVTPERQLVSTDAAGVAIPGMEGEMTVMENHTPTVTTLRPGIVRLEDGTEFVVSGGFAEISESGASVLAEMAVPRTEATRDLLEDWLKEAEAAFELAAEEARTTAALKVNDMSELIRRLG